MTVTGRRRVPRAWRRLSAHRVAVDRRGERRLAGKYALVDDDELAARVVERCRRQPARSIAGEEVAAGVLEGGVGHREARGHLLCRLARVVDVDAQERHPGSAAQRLTLEERKLGPAGLTPGGPHVHDD